MIDLRSDTFTTPDIEMRKFIATAEVGDDVFGEDPTVNELERYVAKLLGKEAALFVTSGTMGNQLAIASLTKPGDEIILESESHIFYYEAAAPAVISRVQPRCINSENGAMALEKIAAAVRGNDIHFPRTSLICVENTHNRHGGAIIPLEYLEELSVFARSRSLKMHCDGARLWEAVVAANLAPGDVAACFDTITVCLSKGLGAPVGSVLAGDRETIGTARKWRKMLGGGMRQAGIIAAGGLFALHNNLCKLSETHRIARVFAEEIAKTEKILCDLKGIHTNIVLFQIPESVTVNEFEGECGLRGLKIIPFGERTIRAVFHFQISEEQALTAAEIISDVINNVN